MATAVTRVSSPIGDLTLLANDAGLVGLRFETTRYPSLALVETRPDDGRGAAGETLALARRQLDEYFARRRTTFDLPLVSPGTPFQEKVWSALRTIPFGGTESYAALARRIGASGSARAVGAANGQNPIAIIVPCHRVIGANGELTGFGGGIERKRWLLVHEGAIPGFLDTSTSVDV